MSQTGPGFPIGCTGFGTRGSRSYFDRLGAVELQQTFLNPPQRGALKRLRERAGSEFVFVVKVWQLVTHESGSPGYRQLPRTLDVPLADAGHFRDSDAVRLGWSRSLEAAEALDARALVFESPPGFTPTAGHRRTLARFFESMERPAGRLLVWCPSGLWDPDDVVTICSDLNLVPGWDPFVGADAAGAIPPDLGAVYLRPMGLGGSQQYSETQLLWMIDRLEAVPPGEALCLFGSPLLFSEAERMLGLSHA